MPFVEGCFGNTRWTEKAKADFAIKCSHTDTVENLAISFTGFQFNEIESVLVRQIEQGKTVDSFYIHALNNQFDSIRSRYGADIDRKLFIKDTYQIIISGQKPFILSNMKMVMWPRFTMFSENYGCVMGDYTIDGIEFKHNANPDFVKEGFK